jgi:hypothetical protein
MFSFFGLFADPDSDLPERLSGVWPELNVVRIERPISAFAIRFSRDYYEPSDEDTPETVVLKIAELSAENPTLRFLLLRTECWDGICANWGQVFQDGKTTFKAEGDGALRRLITFWGVDLGPREIFEPLRRDFSWQSLTAEDSKTRTFQRPSR